MFASFLVRKVRRNLEDYGWSTTLRKSLSYLLKPFYAHQVYRIYRIDLAGARHPDGFDAQGLMFRFLGPNDSEAIDQIGQVQEWLQRGLKESIRNGGLCLAALQDGKVAGFNWIGFGEVFMPLVNKRKTFRKQDAWSEQIAVLKEFRQRGLAAELRYRIFDALRARGFRRLYGGALTSNMASLKLARKVGFREIVDIHYIRILGQDTWRYKRVKQ